MLKRITLCFFLLAFAPPLPANAQTISLDGQYIGHAFSGAGGSYAYWGFTGANSDPGAALSNVTASQEGEQIVYALGYFGPLGGGIQLDDGEGNGLAGFLSVGGWLGEPWEGTFQISQGTGRYVGFTGSGTVTVAALPQPNPDCLTAFTIKGAAAPAVPEPSTLGLLGAAGIAALVPLVRRRSLRNP